MAIWIRRKGLSWHIADPADTRRTLCGRDSSPAFVETSVEPRENERTCESCLRIAHRRQEEI